jgi:glycosyltransferase involved in cell wall biosynthesis
MQITVLRRLAPDRDDPVTEHVRLASHLADSGEYAEAEKHHAAAKRLVQLELKNSPVDPAVLNDHAVASADLREFEIAIQCLERALLSAPENPSIAFNLAAVLWRKGHGRKAARIVARASLLDPHDQGIQQLSRRIEGTLSVYESDVHILVGSRTAAAPGFPARGAETLKPLHALRMSLPHVRTGYSYRAQEILLSQQRVGLSPLAVTEPLFPHDCSRLAWERVALEEVEGVAYHRLPAPERFAVDPSAITHYGSEIYRDELREPLDEYLCSYARELLGLTHRLRPHLLHSHSDYKNAIACKVVSRAIGIPHVYEVRGIWEETAVARGKYRRDEDKYRFARELETRCCRDADAVVTLSGTVKDDLVSRGVESEKIFIVPNGANLERLSVPERRCERLWSELWLGAGPVIGYFGSLSAYEGVSDLLTAFRRVLDDLPSARLLVVGGGRDAEQAYATANELELGDAVVFTGVVDRAGIMDYYSLIDLFVVPRPPLRLCELVTPLKVYEAMATGRAVVVSDVRALKELIIEGETAASYRAGNPGSLAEVCLELLRNPDRLARMGANAERWVRRERNWTVLAERYVDVYEYAGLACERSRFAEESDLPERMASGQDR